MIEWPELIWPIVLALAGLILGLLLQGFLLRRWRMVSGSEGTELQQILPRVFTGIIILWVVLAALYLTLAVVPMQRVLASTLQSILVVLAILSAGLFLARLTSELITANARRRNEVVATTTLFSNITRIAILGVAILFALGYLQISITPFLTALGVGGLAVALALQDTLSNFFAGIQIIASRQLKVGDFVRLDPEHEGFVEDITWRNTTLRSYANNRIVVPNAKLANSITVNYNMKEAQLSFSAPFQVPYGSDLQKVERVTLEAAEEVLRETPGGVAGSHPAVSFSALADSGVSLSVTLQAQDHPSQFALRNALVKRIVARFAEEGLEIALSGRPAVPQKSSG